MKATLEVRLVVALLVGLAAPATAAEVVVAENFGPRSNWALETDDAYVLTRAGCLEALARIDFDGVLQPGLATAWRQTAPNAWDFTLRPGVVFADGQRLTAAGVATALNRVLKSATPSRAFSPKVVSAVEAVDDATVRVVTPGPSVVTPFRLASPNTGILSPTAVADGKVNPVEACTGPFTVVAIVPQQSIRLERNAAYWGGPAAIDKAEVRFIPDGDVRAGMVRSGEAHIANYLPVSAAHSVSPGMAIVTIDQPRVASLYLNSQKPPFTDVRVRQAIQAAIDTKAIADTVYDGIAKPAVGPFLPAEPWAPKGAAPVKRDVGRARDLLAQAGVKPGQLRIALLAYTEKAEFGDVATVIQAQLSEAGIESDITLANYSAIEPKLLSGDFQAALLSRNHLTDVADPIGFLVADYSCKGTYNISHFCDPATDAALDRSGALADPGARYAVYAEIAAMLAQDAVDVFLVREQELNAVSTKLANFRIHPLAHYLLTNSLSLAP